MIFLLFLFSPEMADTCVYQPPLIKGMYLSPGVIYSNYMTDEFFNLVNIGLLNTAVLDIKDVKGRVMLSMYKNFIKKAKEKGVYLIGRQCVFKDRAFAFKDSGRYALKDSAGDIWYQEKSGYWVDPSLDEVRKYNIEITKRAYKSGFNEIQYDYIRYPSGTKYYKNNKNKLSNILKFLDEVKKEIDNNWYISLTLYGYTVWGNVLVNEGQNLEEMSERVDAIYPMLYPSHFHGDFMKDSTEESRTYLIIYKSVIKAKERLRKREIRVTPYIQAFDWKQSTMGEKYIENQLSGIYNSKADGFILWEAGGEYGRAIQELIDFHVEISKDRLKLLTSDERLINIP